MEQSHMERTLTSVDGIRVGHWTNADALTGCTIVLCDDGAVGGVDVRGGGPGTRETDLLAPGRLVEKVDAVLLTGGSAFGLAAADGVMRFLEERDIGFDTGVVRVPIVPAAVIFDLAVGDGSVRPGADHGYAACEAASTEPVAEGNVGAGSGATIGKWAGMQYAMKGGLGSSALAVPGGGTVGALVVANALGDIVDPLTGKLVAGAFDKGTGSFVTRPAHLADTLPGANTVLAVVATDVALSKEAVQKVAQMAHDGIARTVYPAHTPWDGDTVFALSTGRRDDGGYESRAAEMERVGLIGAMAAEAVALAMLRGVRAAHDAGGFSSV